MMRPDAPAERYRSDSHSPDPRFPWGFNRPSRRQRLIASLLIATAGAVLALLEYWRGDFHSDFSIVWFGASAMLEGSNPYILVGPGLTFAWDYPLLYPATSLVAAIPFTLLGEAAASAAFTWISTFLLAYGLTRGTWHRLPLFLSAAFVHTARVSQWSTLITAAYFIPWLACFAAVKPQTSLPIIASGVSRSTLIAAAIGSATLLLASLVFLPSWPADWFTLVRSADHMQPPITRFGGFAILLVMLRWRRPEAWLIAVLASIPQTWDWYNVLPLLVVPATFREAGALSLISSLGALLSLHLARTADSLDEIFRIGGAVMVAAAYLPAVVLVLRRPNEGPSPAWLVFLSDRLTKRGSIG